jgi:hypothetical protein
MLATGLGGSDTTNDVDASISVSKYEIASTTVDRGNTVPSKIIGEAVYTEPSLHRTKIDMAANALLAPEVDVDVS